MLMSVAEISGHSGVYPELAGARVLITGLGAACGVDIARSFADHGCRLILQIPEPCPETDAVLQILTESALDMRVHHHGIDRADDATRFTQMAAKAFGGLDIVVNLIEIRRADLTDLVALEDIQAMFATRMCAAAHTTKVAANRMELTWSSGSILNVLNLPPLVPASKTALTGMARTAIAAMTRIEAEKWGAAGIRVNAIAPHQTLNSGPRNLLDCITNEPDMAAVALFLASNQGEKISGMILEADMTSQSCR